MLKGDKTIRLWQEEPRDRMGHRAMALSCFQPEFFRLRSQAGLPVHSVLNFKVQGKAGAQNEFQ